jgi:hypothetical protein
MSMMKRIRLFFLNGRIWSFSDYSSFCFLPREWMLMWHRGHNVLIVQVGPFRLCKALNGVRLG